MIHSRGEILFGLDEPDNLVDNRTFDLSAEERDLDLDLTVDLESGGVLVTCQHLRALDTGGERRRRGRRRCRWPCRP